MTLKCVVLGLFHHSPVRHHCYLTPNDPPPQKSEQMAEFEPAYDQMSTDYSGDYLARLISDDICH